MYKLFREATRSSENGPVKDLSYLNRPLDRVIIVRKLTFELNHELMSRIHIA